MVDVVGKSYNQDGSDLFGSGQTYWVDDGTGRQRARTSAGMYGAQGVAAQERQAPQIDQSQFQQASQGLGQSAQQGLDQQRQAVGMLQGSANGPSSAQAQGQLGNSQALSNMLRSRAQGSSVANSLGQGASAGLVNAAQVGQTRQGEVSARAGAYQGAANGLRSTDQGLAGIYANQAKTQYGLASATGQNALTQQQQNDAYQQAMENNSFGASQLDLNAELSDRARSAKAGAFNVGDQKQDLDHAAAYLGTGTKAAGDGLAAYSNSMGSDERTKDREPRSVEPSGGRPMFTASSGVDPKARGDAPPRQFPDTEGKDVMTREEYPGDVKIALEEEDARKASKRAGVTPLDIKTGGKKPALYLKDLVQQRNEHPQLAEALYAEPDDGMIADANRKMAGEPYTYKDAFVPPDETPGKLHYGFMAQNLEKNPVTATAVETGPDGLKRVHHARMIQAMGTGIADLQRQMDEMKDSNGRK